MNEKLLLRKIASHLNVLEKDILELSRLSEDRDVQHFCTEFFGNMYNFFNSCGYCDRIMIEEDTLNPADRSDKCCVYCARKHDLKCGKCAICFDETLCMRLDTEEGRKEIYGRCYRCHPSFPKVI